MPSCDIKSGGWLSERDILRFRVEVNCDAHELSLSRPPCQWSPKFTTELMWLERDFTDFFIVAQGGREVHCHRSVLSAVSPVFKGMFAIEMQEGKQQFVTIDEPVDAVSALLEFIYVGRLPLEIDCSLILTLLRLADYYHMPILVRLCASRLGPMLSESNIADVLRCLALLRQATNPECESIFRGVVEQVKSDMKLLFSVCASMGQSPLPTCMQGEFSGTVSHKTEGNDDDDDDSGDSDEDEEKDEVDLESIEQEEQHSGKGEGGHGSQEGTKKKSDHENGADGGKGERQVAWHSKYDTP